MNAGLQSKAIAVMLIFFTISITVAAEPSNEDESQLVANVSADGILFGFAQTCKVSMEDLKALFDLKFATARAFARAKVPHYTPENFKRDFGSGIAKAQAFSALADPSSNAFKRNCGEVQEKVKLILQKR